MPSIRHLIFTLPLSAGALACAEFVAPASPSAPSVLGVYALHSAAGAAPPALVQRLVESETGMQMQVYVMSDTLELDANGRYQQRAQLEVRSGATAIAHTHWVDRGTYSVQNGAMHFDSNYFQNVGFGGTRGAGNISLLQDIVGEGTSVEYVLQPAG